MLLILDFILDDCRYSNKQKIKFRLMIYWVVLVLTFGYLYTGPLKDKVAESLGGAVIWPVIIPLKTSAFIFENLREVKIPSIEWSK